MARRGRNTREREFVWARSLGTLGEVGAGDFVADLLLPVRTRHGDAALRGATVMTVKGYIRPNLGGGTTDTVSQGRVSIGVRQYGDIDEAQVGVEGPFGNPEAKWMGWFPHLLTDIQANPQASWNNQGSPWAVDLQSHRIMGSLGQTLALYYDFQDVVAGDATHTVDYDLSVGVKLP